MKSLNFTPKLLSVAFFFLFAVCCPAILAQTDEIDAAPPADVAPPPMTILSKSEKQQLDGEENIKKRTQLCIDLMDSRLKAAEGLIEQSKFQESINELGGFQALLENALNYLNRHDNDSSKVDYNFKRLEIGLRQTVSRLEMVRRGMPFKYGYYVLRLQKFVRDARAKAIEPLFSDTVVPQSKLN